MFVIDKTKGTINLDADRFSATGGQIIVCGEKAVWPVAKMSITSANEREFAASDDTIRVRTMLDAGNATVISVRNISISPVRINDILIRFPAETFTIPLQAREHDHLVHSRRLQPTSGVKPVHIPAEWSEVNPESGLVTVYSHRDTGQCLLIGAIPPFGSGQTCIRNIHDSLHMEGQFGILVRFDFRQELAPGDELRTSPIVGMCGKRGEDLLEDYGAVLRSRRGRTSQPPITGWNSWDYYSGAVTRADMNENILACRKAFGDALRYIVIDEGWECMWGVWQANWKFPEGLKDFCKHVKNSGYVPGIWLAPLMVNVFSPLYRRHPDWFVRDAHGNPYLVTLAYGMMGQLDITHPDARRHITEVFNTLTKCGFEYFKIDFLELLDGAEQFHDPRIGRADLLRTVFTTIRQAVGEDSYIISGAAFEPAIDQIDAFRVTPDIHNRWSHIRWNISSLFVRWWMQGTVGNVDPDFLIVRCPETTDDRQLNRLNPVIPRTLGPDWMNGSEMNIEEARVLATAIYFIGGEIVLSDAIGKLNKKGLDMIQRVLPPLPASTRPLHLFAPDWQEHPVLISRNKKERLIAAFNLSDVHHYAEIELDFIDKPIPGWDFWTDEKLVVDRQLQLNLQPRSVRAIRIPRP